jgi:hypothetical protein
MVDGLLQNMQTYFCGVGSQKMAKAGYFLQQKRKHPFLTHFTQRTR